MTSRHLQIKQVKWETILSPQIFVPTVVYWTVLDYTFSSVWAGLILQSCNCSLGRVCGTVLHTPGSNEMPWSNELMLTPSHSPLSCSSLILWIALILIRYFSCLLFVEVFFPFCFHLFPWTLGDTEWSRYWGSGGLLVWCSFTHSHKYMLRTWFFQD